MKDNITIHDLAKLMNVSPSTVSRALNDHPRISPDTREAIKTAAIENGYRPNNIASSLRRGTSSTIGVIVPRINRHFFSSVIGSMEELLNDAGYNVMILQTQEDHEKEIRSIRTLLNMRVDTIFISLSAGTKDSSHISELIERGVKVIMFDRVDETIEAPSVKLDDYTGAFKSVEHMITQGYRKIIHFAGPQHLKVYSDRKKGYVDALKHNGISPEEGIVIDNVLTREKGFSCFMEIHNSGLDGDAIFSASDFSALGALLAARTLKINVPIQLGIAGFANEPFTEYIQPGITTTDQKPELMGEAMAGMFLKDPSLKNIQREIITPSFIIRGSTLKNSM